MTFSHSLAHNIHICRNGPRLSNDPYFSLNGRRSGKQVPNQGAWRIERRLIRYCSSGIVPQRSYIDMILRFLGCA